MMTIWEHKIIYLEVEAAEIQSQSYTGVEVSTVALYEDALDSFGGEGLELVSVLTHPHPGHPNKHVPTA